MNEQLVAEMRALLDTVGVQRCTGEGAPPPTQCGGGVAAACGCGKKPPCHFTITQLAVAAGERGCTLPLVWRHEQAELIAKVLELKATIRPKGTLGQHVTKNWPVVGFRLPVVGVEGGRVEFDLERLCNGEVSWGYGDGERQQLGADVARADPRYEGQSEHDFHAWAFYHGYGEYCRDDESYEDVQVDYSGVEFVDATPVDGAAASVPHHMTGASASVPLPHPPVPRERTLAARLAFVMAYPHSSAKSLLPVVRAMYVPGETFTVNLRAVTQVHRRGFSDAACKPTTTPFKTKQPVSLSGAGWQPLDPAARFTDEHNDAFTRAHDRAYHNMANAPYRDKVTAQKLANSLGTGCFVCYESSSGYPRWAGKLMTCFERWVDAGIEPVSKSKKRVGRNDIASASTKQDKTARTAVPSEECEWHAGDIASSHYAHCAPKKPVPKTVHEPEPEPEPEPDPSSTDLKQPAIPDLDVQEARILFRNSALLKHLRTHSDGDWVKNPQRKVAGKHTLLKTKDRKADSIKKVVRDWLLTTPQGKRALAAADVAEGELSIDRVLARHDKQNGMSLNCIYNLYLMPVRHNSYFGDTCSSKKRAYIGERAYKLAREAHDAFVRDREGDYDWDAAFAKRALMIVSN